MYDFGNENRKESEARVIACKLASGRNWYQAHWFLASGVKQGLKKTF